MKAILTLLAMILVALPAFAADFTVRDRSGRAIETWTHRGATTDVRDRSGRLQETWTRQQGKTEIRDRSGRLLGTVGK